MREVHDHVRSSDTTLIVLSGFFAGAMIGAGLGLLFAPRAGSALREQIAESAANARKAALKTVDGATELGRDLYGRAHDVVSRAGDELDRVVGDRKARASKGPSSAVEMMAER